MFKKIFGKGSSTPADTEHSIEDLIVLERYDEAIGRLEQRCKDVPNDLHAHLRLAEVFSQVGKGAKALDQYLFVADTYTDDGFYDKAVALLSKVVRLSPGDETVRQKIARIQRLKALEHSRVLAIEGLVEAQRERDPLSRTSPVEVERIWQGLAATPIVERLPGEQLKRLFSGCELWPVSKGQVLAGEGDRAEFLAIVISGTVEATARSASGQLFQLRTFASGDLFGERSLLEHKAWPATYTATENGRVVKVTREGLERAMTGNPDPRFLLDALRAQQLDRDVAKSAAVVQRSDPA
ncbi:MAG: cyclic nucleotide-binding domain-containing protein [Thermoanaerobaculia bacterium]